MRLLENEKKALKDWRCWVLAPIGLLMIVSCWIKYRHIYNPWRVNFDGPEWRR